jgi:hypothetical protein
MDGRGAWRDNVFVERLWRSVKYERVYLRAYYSVSAARADIADYFDWYNKDRPNSKLERLTPNEKYVKSTWQPYPNRDWPRKINTSVRPELPTGPSSTYKSGKSVQTNGATSHHRLRSGNGLQADICGLPH